VLTAVDALLFIQVPRPRPCLRPVFCVVRLPAGRQAHGDRARVPPVPSNVYVGEAKRVSATVAGGPIPSYFPIGSDLDIVSAVFIQINRQNQLYHR
jgi:hypothetical protein